MNPIFLPLILLAVVQGIAEFLPVSSSGHLVILENIPFIRAQLDALGADSTLFINVMLHVATLVAIIVFYFKDLMSLAGGFFASLSKKDFSSSEMNTVRNVLVASIPAGIIGVLINDYIEVIFSNPLPVCILLVLNGVMLIATKRIRQKGRELTDVSVLESLLVGACQAFAILPGISRSGSTIAGGLLAGLKPTEAVRFSFYMAIPVIAGAGLLEALKAFKGDMNTAIVLPLSISMVVCVVVAIFSLRLLVEIARKVRLDLFGYYTIAAGLAGVLFFSL